MAFTLIERIHIWRALRKHEKPERRWPGIEESSRALLLMESRQLLRDRIAELNSKIIPTPVPSVLPNPVPPAEEIARFNKRNATFRLKPCKECEALVSPFASHEQHYAGCSNWQWRPPLNEEQASVTAPHDPKGVGCPA